jgi:hypothetical protein
MNQPNRPIDRAMCEDRLQKNTIRNLWLEEIKSAAKSHNSTRTPLYLTLPGAEGRDIELLISEGIIRTTENMSILEDDIPKIVAVENSNHAIIALQKKFIGLNIQEMPFQNLISGDGNFSWPRGDQEKYCKAKVINLDLNTSLRAIDNEGEVRFPVTSWIDKLCQIHARPPREDWTLCLTLNGSITNFRNFQPYIINFLNENINREERFGNFCNQFWGQDMFDAITEGDGLDFGNFSMIECQKLIMVLVPKLIARYVHNAGWKVDTEKNYYYGGTNCTAPMVTWIVKFKWDANHTSRPAELYRQALIDIFHEIGYISNDGRTECFTFTED